MATKKLVRLLVIGVMVAAASAMAADANGQRKPKGSAPTTRPAQKPVAKTLKGDILHVDVEAKTLKIEVKDKQQVTEVVVTTDERTEVTLDGAVVTLADLREGMSVKVTPDTGPAARVVAKSAPKQKNEKKKPAA